MRKETVAPTVMVAGATGTLGTRICKSLEAIGCPPISVSRKNYDLRVEGEVGVALLAAKPDIVVQATSAMDAGPAPLFRDTMRIGMNLSHACAAAGIRLVQIHAPNVVWPWEDPRTIYTLLAAQDALRTMRDAYVEQYRLNALVLRLPMVFDFNPRRGDGLSVIVAHLCKAVMGKLDKCEVPFHQDQLFSMLHVSDAAKIAAELSVSDLSGDAEVKTPPSAKCSDLVKLVAETISYSGDVVFGREPAVPEEDEPMRPVDTPTQRISMEQGVIDLAQSMMAEIAIDRPAQPAAPKPPRRRRAPAAAASKGK